MLNIENKKLILALVAVFPLVFVSNMAAQACSLSVNSVTRTVTAQFDPFIQSAANARFSISLTNSSDQDCVGRFTITDRNGLPGPYPIGQTQANLQLALNSTNSLSPTAVQGSFNFILPANTTVSEEINFFVSNPPGVRAGLSRSFLDLSITDALNQGGASLAYVPIEFVLDIPSSVEVDVSSFGSNTSAFSSVTAINFGELEEGERRPVLLSILSTADATVSISSANSGVLAHKSSPSANGIPYALLLRGTPLSLQSPYSFDVPISDSATATNVAFEIVIGNTDGSIAGAYSDMVTINVRAGFNAF